MKNMKFLLGTIAAISITGAALAHGGATGIVKERMDGMSAMGSAVKVLSEMMRGNIDYDPEVVKENALKIQMHAGEQLSKLFPEGSDGGPSEAKPDIWSNWTEFEEISQQLKIYAQALENAAPNGLMMQQSTTTSMMGDGGMADGAGMMSGSGMMGAKQEIDLATISAMPADGVFNMLAQTCASCHSKFRLEKK